VRPAGGGSALWLKVEQLDPSGGSAGNRLVHMQDVTARVSAQRDIWAFHSFVSHKLRTPLTSLLIGMGLLQRRAHMLPDDLAMLTETAYSGAQRLKSVVDDIFCYLEAPTIRTQGAGAQLAGMADLIAQLGTDLGITTIHVVAHLGAGAHRLTLGDQDLGMILTEILENARKFHPHHAPAVRVVIHQHDDSMSICVTDDGVTLTPEQLRHIWEPYQQIDSDFTGQVPGIGLGLATVAQICWAAGGTCQITNRSDGPGIRVALELPLAKSSRQAEEERCERSDNIAHC
jgi:signal transduction histidine kinase